jgi:hypothetical protein
MVVGAEEAEEPATETECEEGDAHMDYIYTQHKGKP